MWKLFQHLLSALGVVGHPSAPLNLIVSDEAPAGAANLIQRLVERYMGCDGDAREFTVAVTVSIAFLIALVLIVPIRVSVTIHIVIIVRIVIGFVFVFLVVVIHVVVLLIVRRSGVGS
jgi:hypothetical protein